MKRQMIPIDINNVNNCIAACVRAGQYETALRVYDQADLLTGKDKLTAGAADKYTYALVLLISSKLPSSCADRILPVM